MPRRDRALPMAYVFEWDAAKAAGNYRKHKVTFDEATTVFGDPFFPDEQSVNETLRALAPLIRRRRRRSV